MPVSCGQKKFRCYNFFLELQDANERPLSEHEDGFLRKNFEWLAINLVVNKALLRKLIDKSCVTWFHKSIVEQRNLADKERSIELLSIMQRRSFADFLKFVDCLNRAGQKVVAEYLERGGFCAGSSGGSSSAEQRSAEAGNSPTGSSDDLLTSDTVLQRLPWWNVL